MGRLIEDGVDHGPGTVIVVDGKIASLEPGRTSTAGLPPLRFRASILSPGFVDLQVNGGFGHEVSDDAAELLALACRLPESGVTAFLPTLVSRPEGDYAAAFAAYGEASRRSRTEGGPPAARLCGLHLEGPLLSPRRAGAHDRQAIAASSSETLTRLVAAAPNEAPIALVTLAPEREGALPAIAALVQAGIAVSVGHSDASFEEAEAAFDAGARFATHVFNAMAPLQHRAPGVVGAALSDDRVTALFIADGSHLHPAVLKLALHAKPPRRRGLVSDAISAAGLALAPATTAATATPPAPAGTGRRPGPLARLAGRALHLHVGPDARGGGSTARLADGTLAGATVLLDGALRHAVGAIGLSPAEGLRMVTTVPASALRGAPFVPAAPAARSSDRDREHGRFIVGAPADLVLLDEELHVRATFIDGVPAFVRGGDVDALRA